LIVRWNELTPIEKLRIKRISYYNRRRKFITTIHLTLVLISLILVDLNYVSLARFVFCVFVVMGAIFMYLRYSKPIEIKSPSTVEDEQ